MRGEVRKFLVRVSAVICCAMFFVAIPHEGRTSANASGERNPLGEPTSRSASAPANYFTENAGQLSNGEVRFYAVSGGMQMGFAKSAVLIKINEPQPTTVVTSLDRQMTRALPPSPERSRGVLLRLGFEGANDVIPQGRGTLPFATNFFKGNDPAGWHTNVRSYREIVYRGLYDGIDLVYRAADVGVKYDFIVAPGADVGVVRMSYDGADRVELVRAGSILVHTAAGDIGDSRPIAYQASGDVQCSFISLSIVSVGFACESIDRSRELVIDPLIYSTYLGGGGEDSAISIAADSSGNAYISGFSRSVDFPTTLGTFDSTLNGSWDAFAAKLDPTGASLLYSTYIGGVGIEVALALRVDSSGDAYLTGFTNSTDFPTTLGALDSTLGGFRDAFVTKLDPTGGSLLYSTYLGGSDREDADWMDIDSAGNVYVTGGTYSTDFPVTPDALSSTLNGSKDGFVAELDSAGSSLIFSSYIGGDVGDESLSIDVDSAGDVYVTLYTHSANMTASSGALDATFNGDVDVYVAKLDPASGSLLYATYIGSDGSDEAYSIAVDSAGNAYVAGHTTSADFPTTPGAYDSTDGTDDIFVLKLNSTGGSLLYSTYLGGSGSDYPTAIALDSGGSAYVTGFTVSTDFPVTPDGLDITFGGGDDSFVTRLDPAGSSLLYSSYLGGSEVDDAYWIALYSVRDVYVAGLTASADFPITPGVYDTTLNVPHDAFVVKMSLPNTPPSISVTSPSGGETWIQESAHQVNWTASDYEDASSALLVWINYTSGAGSGSVCGPVAGDSGSCSWILPTIAATDVVINGTVVDSGGLKGYDDTGQFTIQAPPNTPPTVTITSPVGGEVWLKGSSHTITWTMHDDQDINANLTVYLNYTALGVTHPIVAALEGEMFFTWILPAIEATDVVVNITVIDSGGLKNWSQSGPFTIKAPPTTPPSQDFIGQYWWLIVVIVAVVIVLLLALLLKKKKPKEEREEEGLPTSRHEESPPDGQ